MGVKIKKIAIILLLVLSFITLCGSKTNVKADELSDNVKEQLSNIDFKELEEYFNNLNINGEGESFFEVVSKITNGEYNTNYSSIFDYVFKSILLKLKNILPLFAGVIIIALLHKIFSSIKSSTHAEEINKVISFLTILTVSAFLITGFKEIFETTENVIKNLAKLSDITSPIILTLMTVSGANVSVSLYKPAVVFFSNGIVNVILYVVLPLIALSIIFFVIGKFSSEIKLDKFTEVINGIIKWVIGISVTIFTIFLSIQGLGAATHDGISLKAVKYAISNSIPVVGGFLKDGFDLMVAGSILIKNAVGVGVIFMLLHTISTPILFMIAFSIGLKIVSSVSGICLDFGVSDICDKFSKGTNYMIATLLLVGFMIFITFLLMIISANAFI